MQQKLFQNFFMIQSWSFWKRNRKGTIKARPKIEIYIYIYINIHLYFHIVVQHRCRYLQFFLTAQNLKFFG